MVWLIAAAVFVIPVASIVAIPGTIIWYPQYLAFIFFGLLVFSFSIWKSNKILSILAAYLSFSYVFIAQASPRSMLCLVSSLLGILLICKVAELKNTKPLFYSFVAIAVLQFFYVLCQNFNIDPFFRKATDPTSFEVVGFLGSHNQLAIFYAAITPLLFSIHPLFAAPVMAVFFMAKCTSAIVGAAAGCLLLNKHKLNGWVFVVVSAAILVYGAVLIDADTNISTTVFSERLAILKLTLKEAAAGVAEVARNGQAFVVKTSPLVGFGVGNFFTLAMGTQENVLLVDPRVHPSGHYYEHAHNDLVECFFDLGYIGTAIVLAFVAWLVLMFIEAPKTNLLCAYFCSVVAQAVCSLGVYIVHAPVSFFIFCLTIGLFLQEARHANKSAFTKVA